MTKSIYTLYILCYHNQVQCFIYRSEELISDTFPPLNPNSKQCDMSLFLNQNNVTCTSIDNELTKSKMVHIVMWRLRFYLFYWIKHENKLCHLYRLQLSFLNFKVRSVALLVYYVTIRLIVDRLCSLAV